MNGIPIFRSRRFWIGILPLLWVSLLPAQTIPAPQRETAFAGGERLTYAISYKAGVLNTDVAEVIFSTTLERSGNQQFYRIRATGKTHSFFNWFFDLDDSYTSRLDASTLRPIDLAIELREGSYRVSAGYRYNWNARQVRTFHYNHKRTDTTFRTMPLQERSYDALALFYNLRCEPLDSFVPGADRTLSMVLDDTIRSVRYQFVKRENKTIKGLGKFKTLRFVCQLATSSGESFEDGSEFTIWISDDLNKIPLYIESPIRVGSIRGRLLNAEKLKYPLESMIR